MKKIISYIFIVSAMLIWGTSFLVMKNTLDSISSGFLIFLRASITFIILLPLSIKHFKDLTKKNIKLIIISGIIVGIGYIIQAIGISYTTPGRSAFLEDAYCIVTPLLTSILSKKKLTIKKIICIILCVIGVILISSDSINGSFGIGDIFCLIAGICYGINIAITGLYVKDTDPISYTCGQFLIMSIISGVYSLIFERGNELTFNKETIFSILYLGLIVTALAWVFRNYAQQYISPISVSLILPFSAVFGTIISIIAKEDTLTLLLVIGGLLITSSIILDTLFDYYNNKKENGQL